VRVRGDLPPHNFAVSLPGLDRAVLDRYLWENDRLSDLAEYRLRHPIMNSSKDPRPLLRVTGFSATNAIALNLYQNTLAKSPFLRYGSFSVPTNP